MHFAILFSIFFGLNLLAADEKEAGRPELESMTNASIIEKDSHFPGFMCQRRLAVIESMALTAIKENNREWALIAYAQLYFHYSSCCDQYIGMFQCLGASALITSCVMGIVEGSKYFAFSGAAACLSCISGAVNIDNSRQRNSIEKKLLVFLEKSLPAELFDSIIQALKSKNAYLNMIYIFDKYPDLNLNTNKINGYCNTKDEMCERHNKRCCCKF